MTHHIQRCVYCSKVYHSEDLHNCTQPPYQLPRQINNFFWIEVNDSKTPPLYENESYNYTNLSDFFASELVNIGSFLLSVQKKLKRFSCYPRIVITFKDVTGTPYAEGVEFQQDKIEVNSAEDIIEILADWKNFILKRARGCELSNKSKGYGCVKKVSFLLMKNQFTFCSIS